MVNYPHDFDPPGGPLLKAAACTIVSPNYLAYARTLAASYTAHHPDQPFFVLIVADLTDPAPFAGLGFTPVMLSELPLADIRGEAMKYDILELNTNVKPTFLKYLFRTHGFDAAVYLDPDIFCYAPLAPVFDPIAAGANAVLTPHMTTPVFDGKLPSEQDLLVNGTFNLGFIAVRNSTEGLRLLDWWEERVLNLGFSEGRTGLFVDQKWLNHAPGLFADVHISRYAGLNMAYWNIHERSLEPSGSGYTVRSQITDNVPLCFFHFSGIVVKDPDILSKHTNRFTLASRPDLQPLFTGYKAAVRANQGSAAEALPYGFDSMSDGTSITRLARRIYAAHQQHFTGEDPFQSGSRFGRFAARWGLMKGRIAPPSANWAAFNPKDRRVETVHKLLKMALRVLGPHKYDMLMRYLAHISVLRHQAAFLRDPQWPEGQ